MTWINTINKVYNEYFEDSFNKLGLVKYEETNQPGIGASIKFRSEAFRIQIINDRGLLETAISPLFGDEQFRSIETFNTFLQLESMPENSSELDKKKVLGARLDFVKQKIFLLDNYERLKVLLDKNNFKEIMKRIDAQHG